MTTTSKPRTAFFACFLAAFLLIWLAAFGAVYQNAVKPTSFEAALLQNVDAQRLGTDEKSLASFAHDTIAYLVDDMSEWEPQITLLGYPASTFIPAEFVTHMASVKGWVKACAGLFLVVVTLVAALLLYALQVRRLGGKRGLYSKGYYTGAGTALLLITSVGLWAVLDFNSLWGMLHVLFITDGIFPAGELVMQLFPITLFSAYLPAIVQSFVLFCGAVLLLPPLLRLFTRAQAGHSENTDPNRLGNK